jgi:hypothetical protein
MPVDPQLLQLSLDENGLEEGDGLEDVVVSQLELDNLYSRLGLVDLSPSDEETTSDPIESDSMALKELLQISINDAQDAQDGLSIFISTYSRINILCNEKFARAWKQFEAKIMAWEKGPGIYSTMGNSRDPPTPWMFKCAKTPGCQYTSLIKGAVTGHENTCDDRHVQNLERRKTQKLDFRCEWEGCEKAFADLGKLNAHIKYEHKFEAKPCPFGCDPEKLYQSEKTLQTHISNRHSDFWPTRCLYPSCPSTKTFQVDAYRHHLRNEHGLAESKAREPYMPTKQFVKCWDVNTTCPVPGCPVLMSFSRRQGLRVHLKNKHDYTSEQASSATLFGFVMKPYQEWLKVKRTEVEPTEE